MRTNDQLNNVKNFFVKLDTTRTLSEAKFYSCIPSRIGLFITLSMDVGTMLKVIQTPFTTAPTIMRQDLKDVPASIEYITSVFDGIFGNGFYDEIICYNHNYSRGRMLAAIAKWIEAHDHTVKLQKELEVINEEVAAINTIVSLVNGFADIKKNMPNSTFQRLKALKVSKNLRICEIQSQL